jgi:hypothetical protein
MKLLHQIIDKGLHDDEILAGFPHFCSDDS